MWLCIDEGDYDGCLDTLEDNRDFNYDYIVPKEELDKIWLILKERKVLLGMSHVTNQNDGFVRVTRNSASRLWK